MKVLTPLVDPVITTLYGVPAFRDDGTVIVPDRLLMPLTVLTVRVLAAIIPPTVTPEIVSAVAQPDPAGTVITVPAGPELGLQIM
jgi:hypothetical protein